MSDISSNLTSDASVKSTGLAAGLMAALSGKFGETGDTSLFASLLSSSNELASSQMELSTKMNSGALTATGQTSATMGSTVSLKSGSLSTFASSISPTDMAALKNLTARLQAFVAEHNNALKAETHSTSKTSTKISTSSSGQANTAQTAVTNSNTTGAVSSSDDNSDTALPADDASVGASTLSNDPLQNILNLLATLQQIMKMLAPLLPAVSISTATSTSTAVATATNASTDENIPQATDESITQASDTKTSPTAPLPSAPSFDPLLAETTSATTGTPPASNPSDGITTGSDLLTAADGSALDMALHDVLALLRNFEKQLTQIVATGSASTGTSVPSNSATNIANVATSTSLSSSTLASPASLVQNVTTLLDKIALGFKTTTELAKVAGVSTDTPQTLSNSATTAALAATPSATLAANTNMPALASAGKVMQDLSGLWQNAVGGTAQAMTLIPANSFFSASSDKGMSDRQSGDSGSNTDTITATAASSADTADQALLTTDATKSNPFTFASQLSATRSATSTTGFPSVVEQVVLQISRGAKDGDSQMSLQLHPADLGKITIKLDFSDDGKVQGTVVADNASTLDLLHKDVRSLERALQEAGLRADPGSLQFSLGGQQQNNSSQQTANDQSSASTDDNVNSSSTLSIANIPVTTAEETYYITPGRVNLKV